MVPSSQAAEHVGELEALGYGAVWIPEAVGREAFTSAALLLRGGSTITVATGIASIYARDPMSAAAAQKTVTEAYPDRFLLGLGVSHQVMVEGIRGHDYSKPYSAMVAYLDAMDQSMFMASGPTTEPRRVLAALGPRMLRLSGEKAAGAFPYFQVPEHTAFGPRDARRGPAARGREGRRASRPIRPRHVRSPAPTRRPTRCCRTTRTTCAASASRTRTSRTAAATAWSTRSSAGATSTPSSPASRSTSTPAPTTSASRSSTAASPPTSTPGADLAAALMG